MRPWTHPIRLTMKQLVSFRVSGFDFDSTKITEHIFLSRILRAHSIQQQAFMLFLWQNYEIINAHHNVNDTESFTFNARKYFHIRILNAMKSGEIHFFIRLFRRLQ